MAHDGMFLAPENDPRTDSGPMGELATYREYLTNHRLTLELKCEGLTPTQLATASVAPSELSLLGLLRHMARVEHHWFHRVLRGNLDAARLHADDPTGGFRGLSGTRSEADAAWAAFREQVGAADEYLATLTDEGLDTLRPLPRGGETNVRDILVHMIEEYARHCGHADLIREVIDGRTGV